MTARTPTTAEPTTTPPSTVADARRNPWRSATVTVAVDTGPYSNEPYVTAVRRAAAFWTNHSSATPHSVSFEVVPNAADPDVRVDVERSIDRCNGDRRDSTFYWCGDTYAEGEVADGVSDVRIAGGYTTASTTRFVKGAFADLLGVRSSSVAGLEQVEEPRLRDPWPKPEPVVVAINQTATPRNVTPVVRDAIRYWETEGATHANYTTDFVVRPDAPDPDVVVEFTREVATCAAETGEFLGCAPVQNQSTRVTEQKTIQVEAGYTDASTRLILKHEFGHLVGRYHGQAPMPVMDDILDVTRRSMPNATERRNPWMDDALRVYVDYASLEGERDRVRAQVQHALDYYSNGADGYAPPDLTLELTRNASQADVRVRSGDLENGGGVSAGTPYGMDLDDDDSLEYYTNQTIVLDDRPTDVVGWHVGYWLATSITSENDPAVFPPPFRNADAEERRNWWREA